MALAGFIILGVFVLVPSYMRRQLELQVIDVSRECRHLVGKITHGESMFTLLKAGVTEQSGKAVLGFDKYLLDLEIAKADLNCNVEKAAILSKQVQHWGRIRIGGSLAGALMTLSGFTLWYVQVQQYTDQFQRLQLRQAELQVAKAEREENEALQRAPAAMPAPSVDVSSAVPEGAPGAGGVEVGESR